MTALPTTRTAPNRQYSVTTVTALAVLLFMSFIPDLAFAQSPFTGGAAQAKTDIIAIVAPIAGIAIIAVGLLCWFGKISWMWLVGVIVGVVLVFGNDQVITWFRGWFGV